MSKSSVPFTNRQRCDITAVCFHLAETIKGFKGLCAGEYDHLPEGAFYMVGTIDEAIAKAEKMAAEAA